jgi:hypothetical protein
MANTVPVYYNPSFSLQSITPVLNDETFLFFLEAYYDWMQTTDIILDGSSGAFSNNEIITGQDSKATATIRYVGSNTITVSMKTDVAFDIGEEIVGDTSANSAFVLELSDNVLRQASRIRENRNNEKAQGKFLEYLKGELNEGIPSKTYANRRRLISQLRDFFKSKSTEEAYTFLFKALFNETIEIRYPGDDILRISAGDFEKIILIRVRRTDTIFNYLNQTIIGQTSEAVGNVIDIKTTFLGGILYAELILKLTSGIFLTGETIQLLNDSTEFTTIYGMVTGTNIIDAGSGYAVGDVLTISGDGSEAEAQVSSVSTGPINKISVNAIGHGYRLNTEAIINNSGTGGTGFALKVSKIINPYTITSGANTYIVGEVSKVSIVNRGSNYFKAPTITLDDNTIKSLGLLSENLITIVSGGTNYAVGDTLVFTGGAGANAAGVIASVGSAVPYGTENLLFEDGMSVLQDNDINGKSSVLKNEDWTNSGIIRRIELTNFGENYTSASLPTITVTSGTGTNASLIATDIQGNSANVSIDIANNSIGLGAIRAIEIKNFGINYTTATIDASSVGDGNANVQAIISGLGISDGIFLTDNGKIGIKIIQDSLFYQDFSYVIRSGLEFDAYKEIIKELIHPAGLQFFGEILIFSYIFAAAQFNSTVSIEREQLEVIIKKILSFFPGAVNPITTETEKNLELEIDVGHIAEHREINVEIAPLTIDQSADFLPTKNFDRYIEKDIDLAIDVPVIERQIYIILGQTNENLPIYSRTEFIIGETTPNTNHGLDITFADYFLKYSPLVMMPRILGRQQYDEILQNKVDIKINPLVIDQSAEFLPIKSFSIDIVKEIDLAIVNSIELKTDIKLEIDVGHIAEHREINVEIAPLVIDQSADFLSAFNVTLELFLDATMVESIATVEIDVVTELQTIINHQREINIEIAPLIIDQGADFLSAFNVTLELFLDATMVESIATVEVESIATVEIDVVTELQTIINHQREINIEIAPLIIDQSADFLPTKNFDRYIEKDIDLATNSFTLSKIDTILELQINNFNQFDVNEVTFAELNLYTLSSFPISTYSSNTILNTWESYGTVKKNLKVSGTVTLSGNTAIGTGTSFDVDFGINNFIIVNEEKFKVISVANSTFLTLNVNPVGTYTNVSAYKEVFV